MFPKLIPFVYVNKNMAPNSSLLTLSLSSSPASSQLVSSYLPLKTVLLVLIILLTMISYSEAAFDEYDCVPFIHQLERCTTAKREEISFEISVTTSYKSNFTITDFDSDQFELKGNKVYLRKTANLRKKELTVGILASQLRNGEYTAPSCMILKVRFEDVYCSYGEKYCTIVISLLAAFCLILLTAFSISLIILRRKKPLSLTLRKIKQTEEDPYSNGHQPNPISDTSLIIPRKASSVAADIANGTITRPTFSPPDGLLMPRKSSLKQSRIEVIPVKDDPLKMITESGIENAAYQESETPNRRASVIPELDESNDNEPKPDPSSMETRRKSIVTFSDKTEVIRIHK